MTGKRDDSEEQQLVGESLREAHAGCLLAMLMVMTLPFAILATVFVSLGMREANRQARLNQAALEVPATILSSSLRGEKKSYWPEVEFSYQHAGETRTSNRLWAISELGPEARMREVVDRYAEGEQRTALVDPDDSSFAFLERRWSIMPYVTIAIGCISLTFLGAIVLHVVGWRRLRLSLFLTLLGAALLSVVLGFSALHYWREFPESERQFWVVILFSVGALALLGTLVSLARVARLHRFYLSEG